MGRTIEKQQQKPSLPHASLPADGLDEFPHPHLLSDPNTLSSSSLNNNPQVKKGPRKFPKPGPGAARVRADSGYTNEEIQQHPNWRKLRQVVKNKPRTKPQHAQSDTARLPANSGYTNEEIQAHPNWRTLDASMMNSKVKFLDRSENEFDSSDGVMGRMEHHSGCNHHNNHLRGDHHHSDSEREDDSDRDDDGSGSDSDDEEEEETVPDQHNKIVEVQQACWQDYYFNCIMQGNSFHEIGTPLQTDKAMLDSMIQFAATYREAIQDNYYSEGDYNYDDEYYYGDDNYYGDEYYYGDYEYDDDYYYDAEDDSYYYENDDYYGTTFMYQFEGGKMYQMNDRAFVTGYHPMMTMDFFSLHRKLDEKNAREDRPLPLGFGPAGDMCMMRNSDKLSDTCSSAILEYQSSLQYQDEMHFPLCGVLMITVVLVTLLNIYRCFASSRSWGGKILESLKNYGYGLLGIGIGYVAYIITQKIVSRFDFVTYDENGSIPLNQRIAVLLLYTATLLAMLLVVLIGLNMCNRKQEVSAHANTGLNHVNNVGGGGHRMIASPVWKFIPALIKQPEGYVPLPSQEETEMVMTAPSAPLMTQSIVITEASVAALPHSGVLMI